VTQLRPEYAWSPVGWSSEFPTDDLAHAEVWCYTDRFSYHRGDQVRLHGSTTAETFDIEVVRDGARPRTVLLLEGVPGKHASTAPDCYATGCGWPVLATIDVDASWSSGFYLVLVRTTRADGTVFEREHFFVVKPDAGGPKKPLALVLSTSTMMAYNDWGGANQYRGIGDDPRNDIGAPVVSARRPIARGMLRKPPGAPRESNSFTPPPFWQPRYEAYEWARYNGYSRHHADAFWATYERPFVVWAEEAGYELDYLTQHDLDADPDVLAGHRCVILVGHDEYWSWRMRDAVDRLVDSGGNVARFGGNFFWQVRITDDGDTQICYRDPAADPVTETADAHLVTTAWDYPPIGRPAAETMGLTGSSGVYARYGNAAPRSSGGFTVYRPNHWAFDGTDLYYGDVIGAAPVTIAAFELDSVEYTFRQGQPYPTFVDGAPENLEIIAMCPAVLAEEDRWSGTVPLGSGGASESQGLRELTGRTGDPADPSWQYGSGMMATFTRNGGTVFNAGTTEWVNGLVAGDFFTEKITRNALDRLGG